jgi:hypothetical protein
MAYRLDLPDGSFLTVLDDAKPRSVALAEAKSKFPEAFPAPPGIGQQILGLPAEIGKGFIRGLTVDPISGAASTVYTGARAAGADLTPFEKTAVGKGLASAQTALAPSDEGLITQFGSGLGSLLSYIPGGLLKGGIGLAAKLGQAGSVGAEEARSRAEQARLEGQADATAGQEFAAQLGGTAVGFSELAPVKLLTRPIEQILRGVPKSQADLIAPGLFNSAKRMVATGGVEGLQEGMANIAQDLIAKGIYNPNLEVGESALGDAAMGASIGAFAQGAIELATRGKRGQLYEQLKTQERLKEEAEQQRIAQQQQAVIAAQEQEKMGQAMGALGATPQIDPATGKPVLLLGAPAQEVNLQDPLGIRFDANDLGPKVVNDINKARKERGLPAIQQFTVEDLYDLAPNKNAISEMLGRKMGYDETVSVTPRNIFDVAVSKNIDVQDPGFAEFLTRTTGTPDVRRMTAQQLFAAQQSLSALPDFTELTKLPTGSVATVFDEKTYDKTINGLKKTVLNTGPQGKAATVQDIMDFSGLTDPKDAERLLQTAIQRGDLSASPTRGTVGTSINISVPFVPKSVVPGPDIRRGDFMESEAVGYDIVSEDGTFKQFRPTLGAAEDLVAKANQNRETKVARITGEIDRVSSGIELDKQRLGQLQEVGEEGSPEYKRLQAKIQKQEVNLGNLNSKIESVSQPLQIKAKAKPRSRTGYTLFDNGKPIGTYPTKEDADIAAIQSLSDEQLDGVINAAPRSDVEGALEEPFGKQQLPTGTIRGATPRRLYAEATREKERRFRQQAGLPPLAAPVQIKITGDAQAAAEKLRAVGITVRFMPEVEKEVPEINKRLRAILDKLGLQQVRLNIVESLSVKGFIIDGPDGRPMGFYTQPPAGTPKFNEVMAVLNDAKAKGLNVREGVSSANGSYVAKLIEIALDSENPIRAARHEALHALKDLGFFTPDQWRVLENKAKSEWIKKYNIEQRYGSLDKDSQIEEAIADAFSDFDQTKPPAGLVGTLFRKVKTFFEALGNAFRGSGFQTANDVFTRVEEGALTGPGAAVTGEQKFSLTLEETADVTPLGVQQARVYEKELDALIKKIGDRIVGMKSGETLDNVRKAVKKLQSYTAQGLKGKDWYENSAKAVLDAFNGDPILAEKFFQIIAITSANTEVAANFTKASNAWTQFATGKPIKVGTENENKKINALLNFGEDWEGRKTNTFYTNLMEAMDGKDSGRSTIDLHMTRMLFDKDAPTEAQYILAENMVRLLASKIGLPARQVQAASWVTQKAKTIFDEYRKKGWKKGLNDDQLREFAFERAVADYSHLMKARVKQLPITDALKELSSNIRTRVQNITGEVIPSVKTEMAEIEDLAFKDKENLTKQVANSKTVEKIAAAIGISSKVRVTLGSGAYEGKVNPNLIVQVVNDDPLIAQQDALDLANGMSYVFKQDATPFFRADPALLEQEQIGYKFKFSSPLTPAKQKKILGVLNKKFGENIGFTKTRANEIVIINYRGSDGVPFLVNDTDFMVGISETLKEINSVLPIDSQEMFGAQSEYPYHDWQNEPSGVGIVSGIQNRRPERPNLQRGLDNLRESFVSDARQSVRKAGREPKFSLRFDELVDRSGLGDGISIREQQPSAQSFDAVHYGKQRVNTLAGSMYGTGIKGAEAQRLSESDDPRISERVYFYIPYPNGRMPMPEAGLGNEVHIQRLNNLLGPSPEAQALSSAARTPDGQFDANAFESSVIDAGYDGYAIPDMGMAVVLGADVPVISRGTRQEVEERPEEGKIQIGDRKYSLRQTDTDEFKQWFGDSTIRNEDGSPKVMYHGTARDITEFEPKQANAIFVTEFPGFAYQFAGASEDYMIKEMFQEIFTPEQRLKIVSESASELYKNKEISKVIRDAAIQNQRDSDRLYKLDFIEPQVADLIREKIKVMLPSGQNIMPLYVRAENPFDYENTDHVKEVVDSVRKIAPNYTLRDIDIQRKLTSGVWNYIEDELVQQAIKLNGHDSFYVKEAGVKNFAVYDPNQIKSAIGNIGTFARDNNDIRYSIALGSIEPSTSLIPDVGGNPNGILGFMPERLGGKPIRMLVGTHNDLVPELDNERMRRPQSYGANHILNRVLSDPSRIPGGAEELLEKIVKTAQTTAQKYNRIFKEGDKFIIYDGRNSLIVSPQDDAMSIVTMYVQNQPERRYGNSIFSGRAPSMPQEFVEPIRGMNVVAGDGRVQIKPSEVKIIKPSKVLEASPVTEIAPTKAGTLGVKKLSIRDEFKPVDTSSPEFKKFYQNSVLIDESGNPIVLYHGTTKDIESFKAGKEGGSLGNGIYLTPSQDFAEEYAKEEGGNVIPVYAHITNPLVIDGSISRDPMIEALVRLGVDRDKADQIVEKAYEDKGYITNEVKSRATKQGFDGILQYKDRNLTELVAFSPNQIKSAVSNTGEFDPSDKRIQYSFVEPINTDTAQRIPQDTFNVNPNTSKDNLIYLLQNKQIDLKRVIDGIRSAGKDIADKWNAYLKEELFHGRSATRIKFFMDRELQPLLKKMESADISLDQMDEYLLARHAPEANSYIRSINPDPNANAGMSDQEAANYMKSLPASRRDALERIAKDVDAITKGTRQLMVDYGLEDQKTIDTWERTYKKYVPLFREETEGNPISTGRGYQIRGSTTKRRMGSTRSVVDVLANIAMQREKTIVRGEKNRVGNALYGLVLNNPNKGFWGVIDPGKVNKQTLRNELIGIGIDPDEADQMINEMSSRPYQKTIDKATGLVVQRIPPSWAKAENIFVTRINGQDRFIGFNKNDERAMRMATTLKNLDAQQQAEAIKMMGTAGDYYKGTINAVGKATRFFASVNTQYNPAFGIYNLMRDIGGAVLNLQSTPLKGNERKIISDALGSIKDIYSDLRRQRQGLPADSKWANIFEEFELEGGKTGYRDLFEDSQSRAEQLQKDLEDFKSGKPLKGKGKAVMRWLSDFNDAIENAIRVSVYKNALDKGMSKEKAASLAKNITVNFNRTGAMSRNFQTLYAFFNASVQGTTRIAETLFTPDGKLSPTGKKIVMGGITLGLMQAVLLAMAGLDDDEVPDFVKDKSFIIPYGDGKYLAVPMPLGYNIIPGFGRRVMEFAMSDDKNVGKSVFETANMIIDGFNPLGSATFVQTLAPTIADPIVALAENKDFTGKPIAREDINSLVPTPGYTRKSQNASAITEALAYGINRLSGGTEFKQGVISPTPDQIEYLVGQVFGGVGREAMKVGRGLEALATGEELATYNIPIAGRLVGNIQQKAAQTGRFYDNIKALNEHQAEIEGRMARGEDITEYVNDNPEAMLYQLGDKTYSKISKLRQLKKTLEESGASRGQTKVIDDAMLNLMVSLNMSYNSARQR